MSVYVKSNSQVFWSTKQCSFQIDWKRGFWHKNIAACYLIHHNKMWLCCCSLSYKLNWLHFFWALKNPKPQAKIKCFSLGGLTFSRKCYFSSRLQACVGIYFNEGWGIQPSPEFPLNTSLIWGGFRALSCPLLLFHCKSQPSPARNSLWFPPQTTWFLLLPLLFPLTIPDMLLAASCEIIRL